uniref:(California timema) hypothetical protein n=1 Tax=Timema californicum TaxID=61474 RepID=A0A7R9JA08_TIMCA|nr:unnamed protein product [Timema californicum]
MCAVPSVKETLLKFDCDTQNLDALLMKVLADSKVSNNDMDMLFATASNSHLATVSRLVSTRNTITQHSRPLLQITEEDQDVSTSSDQPDQHRQVTYMKPHYDPGQAPPAITIALWTHIISFLLVVSLCWTDMLPVIGKGSSASNFWNLTRSGLLCHFGYDSHLLNPSNSSDILLRIDSAEACHQIVLFAWPFAISYLVFVLSSTQFLILSESSVFTVAMMTTALPLSGIWWSLFRMVGLSAQSNGELIEWSPMVTGELICSVLGLPIVLVGLILLFKAHFRERSYGKFVITCLRRQPADH